jgi:transcriptional regulator with XRE-family HTH domain
MKSEKIICDILEYLKINPSQFARNIKVNNRQQIKQIENGTFLFNETIVKKILSVYPVFRQQWLLTGEGEMLESIPTQKGRLWAFVKTKGITISELHRRCGLVPSHLYSVDKLSGIIVNKISAEFPTLNIAWLLTGEGEMLRNVETKISSETFQERVVELIKLGRVPAYKIVGASGVSQATLSKITSGGSKNVSIETVNKLAKYFNVDFEWLLYGKSSQDRNIQIIDKETTRQCGNECHNCSQKDNKIEELIKRIGVLEYQLEQTKK